MTTIISSRLARNPARPCSHQPAQAAQSSAAATSISSPPPPPAATGAPPPSAAPPEPQPAAATKNTPPLPPPALQVEVVDSIEKVDPKEWDDLVSACDKELNPFLLHGFLYALEASGSACKQTGWLPQHLLIRDGATGALVGACPLYLKSHSYGEYVFDQVRTTMTTGCTTMTTVYDNHMSDNNNV